MTTSTTVNTKKARGRRIVRYESFDDILADAERLATIPTRTLGNWSVGQIYKHLALATEVMLDGAPAAPPAIIQFFLRLILKKRMTTRSLSPGFMLPNKAAILIPEDTSIDDGLQMLRAATHRIKQSDCRAPHPAFGRCSRDEWDAFHCRHCEMHMSFIVPVSEDGV